MHHILESSNLKEICHAHKIRIADFGQVHIIFQS